MEFLGFAVIVVVGFLLVLRSRRGKQDDKQTGDGVSARWRTLPLIIPPLITGGPMLLAIPASMYALKDPGVSAYLALMAFAGGAGLVIGLVLIFVILLRQGREIVHLRELLDSDGLVESDG